MNKLLKSSSCGLIISLAQYSLPAFANAEQDPRPGTSAPTSPPPRVNIDLGPWGGIQSAVVFNLRLFYFDKKFNEDIKKAVEAEKEKLIPGETFQYYVRVRYVAGQKDWPQFVSLQKKDTPAISPADTSLYSVGGLRGVITVSQPRHVFAVPLVPVTRAIFDEVLAKGPEKLNCTYDDYSFGVQVKNGCDGFKETFDAKAAADGRFTFTKQEFIDSLDREARSGADGRIILISKAEDADYSIYNLDTKRVEKYKKKEFLTKSGNTVYVLMNDGAKEYLLAYRGLEAVTAQLGAEVKRGDVLGKFAEYSSPEKKTAQEFWRITDKNGRFLETRDKPGGDYRIW